MHKFFDKLNYYFTFLAEATFKFAQLFLLFIIAVVVIMILAIAALIDHVHDVIIDKSVKV